MQWLSGKPAIVTPPTVRAGAERGASTVRSDYWLMVVSDARASPIRLDDSRCESNGSVTIPI